MFVYLWCLFFFQGHEGGVSGNGAGGGSVGSGGSAGSGAASGEPRRKRQDDNKPNHVLLFTIINPMYPITVVSNILSVYLFKYKLNTSSCCIY